MIQWLRSNYFNISVTVLGFFIIACSSQEYTTAKLAIQQSDWAKAEEWLPKAMAVEPDNPEIPIVGTGMESTVAKDSRSAVISSVDGKIVEVDSNKIVIETKSQPEELEMNPTEKFQIFQLFHRYKSLKRRH